MGDAGVVSVALLRVHRRIKNHGRFSEDRQDDPCDQWCDHDTRSDGYVCSECRDYTGDHLEWPCPTVEVLLAAVHRA